MATARAREAEGGKEGGREDDPLTPQPPPLTWRQAQYRRALKVLGVGRYASETEIKHAYRRRLLETHPDKEGGSDAE